MNTKKKDANTNDFLQNRKHVIKTKANMKRNKDGSWMCSMEIVVLEGNVVRVPQLTSIWMSLPGASGLGKLTREMGYFQVIGVQGELIP